MNPSDITARVLNVYQYLIKQGIIESQHDFCLRIGYHHISFAQVKRGKRPFPPAYIDSLIKAFNINPGYLFEGIRPMFSEDTAPLKSSREIMEGCGIDKLRRLWVKSVNIENSPSGIMINYVTYDDKKHALEFIRK